MAKKKWVQKSYKHRGGSASPLKITPKTFNMKNGGLPEYSLGGDTLGGAASGAAAGMAFGPVGAGVGALVGGVASFIGGKKKQEAEAAAKKAQEVALDKQAAFAAYEPEGQVYNSMFKNGGTTGKKKYTKKEIDELGIQGYTLKGALAEYKKRHGLDAVTYNPNDSTVSAVINDTGELRTVQSSPEIWKKMSESILRGEVNGYGTPPDPTSIKKLKKYGPAIDYTKNKFAEGGPVSYGSMVRKKNGLTSNFNAATGKLLSNSKKGTQTAVKYGNEALNGLLTNSRYLNQGDQNELNYFGNLSKRMASEEMSPEEITTLLDGNNSLRGIYNKTKAAKNIPFYKNDVDSLEKYNPEFVDKYNVNMIKPFLKDEMIKYAMGGDIPGNGIPVELEGGESGIMPNGQDFNVEGPSHAQGGVPMELPEGTDVFSDRLKQKGTNKTYSDLNKQISNKMSKFKKTMEDPESTGISKRTAERMLKRYEGQQKDLFIDQERLKFNKGTLPSKFKMPFGGPVPGLMQTSGQRDLAAFNPKKVGMASTSPQFADSSSFAGDALRGIGGALGKVGGAASGLATAAPAIFNIAQGLFGKPDVQDPQTTSNVAGLAAVNKLQNRRFNVDPMLDANRRSAAIGRRNIAGGARTRGELLSGYAATSAQQGIADSQAYAQQQNMNNQYQGEAASAAMQVGVGEAANMGRVQDYNTRARSAQTGYLQEGLSQVSGLVQQGQKNAGMQDADRIRIDMLRKWFPNQTF